MNSSIKLVTRSVITAIKTFMDKGQSAGLLLIGCTIFSLVMANIPGIGEQYTALWHTGLFSFSSTSFHVPETPVHVINDFLMAFFFLLVAMEIKREIMEGELASVRKSLLPVFAALGGMVCPAVIFGLFNGHTVFSHGWGIPMATDIAFSLGILSLLGDKVPFQLKIFLMALAVMDDMGGIFTIALFYAEQIHYYYLIPVGILLLLLITMNRRGIKQIGYFLLPGLLL
ncbi:Na+:H+ antiporter, NhaA family [Arachidicoccus rhizosphaerae]|uniref:Na+:H+ antiporter, NhaA family n=1 Tax=Arachidicoccus rhizosphaerae TaxID=551991 RepID=A0A1H4CUV1_9BACT|nr:Na+:H+ antiporter, NhaA family [Arachidicoccus rhizosphaerae]